MKVYLAGRAQDYEQFSEQAGALEKFGHTVVSTWHQSPQLADALNQRFKQIVDIDRSVTQTLNALLREEPQLLDLADTQVPEDLDRLLRQQIVRCKKEIQSADWVIADAIGGSMEAGYSLALKKRVIVYGGLPSALSFAPGDCAISLPAACAVLLRRTSPFRRPLRVS